MPAKRKTISSTIAQESHAFLQAAIASGRAGNIGQAVDLAVEALRREDSRKRKERAEPYTAEPSTEEVAEDRATVRAVRDSNPDLLFDE